MLFRFSALEVDLLIEALNRAQRHYEALARQGPVNAQRCDMRADEMQHLKQRFIKRKKATERVEELPDLQRVDQTGPAAGAE